MADAVGSEAASRGSDGAELRAPPAAQVMVCSHLSASQVLDKKARVGMKSESDQLADEAVSNNTNRQ